MDAQNYFKNYLQSHAIRHSDKRMQVLDVFIKCEQHLTINELTELIHKKYPKIGIATVYRTFKLIVASGIARAIEFGDGNVRYEHDYGHKHHDHLICLNCGLFREISNVTIENEQNKIAAKEGFKLMNHKMTLYGLCPKCSKSKGN